MDTSTDDKTRLLRPTKGKNKNKSREESRSLYKDNDTQLSSSVYGTWDGSENARDRSEASSAGVDELIPPLLPRRLHSAAPLQEALSAPLQSFSLPELSAPSSPTASLDDVSKNSFTRGQQNPTKNNSVVGPVKPAETGPLRSSTDSEESNKRDNFSYKSNITHSEQPADSVQDHDTLRITPDFPPSKSNHEHQRNNPHDTEQLDISLGLSDFTHSSDLLRSATSNKASFSTKYPLNLKNQLAKPRTTIPDSKTKDNLRLDTDHPESENRRLFTPSNMEFNGYLRDGKKAGGHDNDKTKSDEKTPFFVYYLACFATIGGLLFGYDTGIVSGSMLLIKDYFELSTMWQEVIVSGTVGAAAVFSLFAGFMCDVFGRKTTIMIASVVFVVGAVIMGASESTGMLLAGRIVVGIGIGFASMTVPVYVAEAAPSAIRGRLVTLNQLFITIGILISSVVAGAFSSMKKTGWRYMLGLAGVPGVIQFIGFLYLPESPRWLVMKGRDEQATKVLQRIRGKEDVQDEVKEIRDAVEEDKKQEGFVLGRVIRTQHVRRALFVGCGLQVFQQLCGINTVIYYSATILKMAGFPAEDAIWLVLVPNSINFLSTFIGLALVERLGRRKLIIVSFLGVVIALVVLAVGFQLSANFSPAVSQNVTEYDFNGTIVADGCFEKHYANCEKCIEDENCGYCFTGDGNQGSCLRVQKHDEDTLSIYGRCQNATSKSIFNVKFSHGFCPTDYTWMAVLGLALFVMAFAPGLGPMPWTINSEIYPMWARSTCNSLATGANWICNLVVSLFFLTLTETITKYGAFWLFGGICFLGMLFTIAFLPETKNKSLEEVEELFKGNNIRGTDNLAYERDIPPPVINSNTRL